MSIQFMEYLDLKCGLFLIKIMLFIPKKTKFKKYQKKIIFNRVSGSSNNNRNSSLFFGTVGLKTTSFGQLNFKQFTMLRQTIRKIIKKKGVLHISNHPDTPITKKSIGVRMGKGKGEVDSWVFKLKPGIVLCEIASLSINISIKALKTIQKRLPIATRLIYK